MEKTPISEDFVRRIYTNSCITVSFENLMEELSFIQERQSERAGVWLDRVHDPQSSVVLIGVDDGVHYFY